MSELSIPLTPQVLFYLTIALIAGGMLVSQLARQFGAPEKKRSARRRPRRTEHELPPVASSKTPVQRDLQLDHDLARLQDLVLTAERQIGRLEELIRTAQTLVSATTREPPFVAHDDLPRAAAAIEPTSSQPPEVASHTLDTEAQSSSAPDTPPVAETPAQEPRPRMLSLFIGEPSATNSNPRYRELHRLFEAGFSNQEISQRLGVPIGEVDLVLGLRQHAHNLQASNLGAKLGDAG